MYRKRYAVAQASNTAVHAPKPVLLICSPWCPTPLFGFLALLVNCKIYKVVVCLLLHDTLHRYHCLMPCLRDKTDPQQQRNRALMPPQQINSPKEERLSMGRKTPLRWLPQQGTNCSAPFMGTPHFTHILEKSKLSLLGGGYPSGLETLTCIRDLSTQFH